MSEISIDLKNIDGLRIFIKKINTSKLILKGEKLFEIQTENSIEYIHSPVDCQEIFYHVEVEQRVKKNQALATIVPFKELESTNIVFKDKKIPRKDLILELSGFDKDEELTVVELAFEKATIIKKDDDLISFENDKVYLDYRALEDMKNVTLTVNIGDVLKSGDVIGSYESESN